VSLLSFLAQLLPLPCNYIFFKAEIFCPVIYENVLNFMVKKLFHMCVKMAVNISFEAILPFDMFSGS
jgi:hypothetical protein